MEALGGSTMSDAGSAPRNDHIAYNSKAVDLLDAMWQVNAETEYD